MADGHGGASITGRDDIPREYPPIPLLGVGAVIVDSGMVALIRRAKPPSEGQWSIPGGLVKLGETLDAAVMREVLEETGLQVTVLELVELLERIFLDDERRVKYHYVLADYLCCSCSGKLAAGSDAAEARWFAPDQLAGLNLPDVTSRVIFSALDIVRRSDASVRSAVPSHSQRGS